MPVAPPLPREKESQLLLHDTLRAMRAESPVTHRGLSMIPLMSGAPASHDSDYIVLRDALAAGVVRITEVSASGSVPDLAVVNSGDRPVLLIDGEELVGAKQNRVVNLTILVPARRTLPIPVSCVEQGRWHLSSPAFADSPQVMLGRVRAGKAREVTQSMRQGGGRRADQGAVWDGIADMAHSLKLHSPTGAMSDLYAMNDMALGEFERVFLPRDGQVGAIFMLGDTVVSLDLFDAASTFRSYLPKLVRASAIERLLKDATEKTDGVASREPQTHPAALVRLGQRFIERIVDAPATTHAAVGLGEDLRIETTEITGAALANAGRIVHLTAFDATQYVRPLPFRPHYQYQPASPVRPDPRPLRIRDNRRVLSEVLAAGQLAVEDSFVLRRDPTPLPRNEATWHRVEGMLLGLAIGDALGNPSEGLDPGARRASHGEIRDYQPNARAGGRAVGLPSDDTQLAFWTLEHLVEHNGLVPERLAERFAREEIYGIGGTVKTFLRRYKAHDRSWSELGVNSAGNGALMRIAPILVPHLVDQSPALWADVALAASLTHNDRASTSACVTFTAMLWELLGMPSAPAREWWIDSYVRTGQRLEGRATYRSRVQGDDYQGSVSGFVDVRVRPALAGNLAVREACTDWYSGAFLLETVPSVLYILAKHGHDPEEAILRAVNETRDNDTIAAIVGAAVGALHGRDALPQRWVKGLLGRTGAADDGRVFELIEAARGRWGA